MLWKGINFKTIGVIGAGSMGAGICLLLAEKGHQVYVYDPNGEQIEKLIRDASNLGLGENVINCKDMDALFHNINDTVNAAIYLMSVPHGGAADKVIDSLKPYLRPDDIIVDCGNEHYQNTEARQTQLSSWGVNYVGCGVSGGYQSARNGPSISPGGDIAVVTKLLPFLQKLAAKDKKGRPCAAVIGPGGSGHYVKMIHNGIEQGMMGVIAEVWLIMSRGLRMSQEEIADTFQNWSKDGELRGCFLIEIASDICRTTNDSGEHVLSTIRDKAVQDAEGSEGTGTWTCMEAVLMHIPAATIASAHLYRCASAFAAQRESVTALAGAEQTLVPPTEFRVDSRETFLDQLHAVTYLGFISSFAEGLNVLRSKDKQAGWDLNYAQILQVWRAGCIIRADHLLDTFDNVFMRSQGNVDDLFAHEVVTKQMWKCMPQAKSVVLKATEADFILPSVSASFEHFKYIQSTHGPAQFVEAQLDYFGKHMYDTWDEPPGGAKTGKHHYEWKPAKGKLDE